MSICDRRRARKKFEARFREHLRGSWYSHTAIPTRSLVNSEVSNHRQPSGWIDSNDFCRNEHVCFRARRVRLLHQRRCGVRMGGVLGQFGLRAIPFGIAAIVLGFILKSAGTQAGPADTLAGLRVSVFWDNPPRGFPAQRAARIRVGERSLRLASLEPQVGLFDASATAAPMPTDTSAATCRDAPFEERFDALEDRPASFDNRFASVGDCASFDERFGLAMRVLPSSPRLPPDQEIQNQPANALPKATVSNVHVRLAQPRDEVPQPRKEVPPLEEDGRTAIYDITARTVYLPSGRRLEAHSGFGDL